MSSGRSNRVFTAQIGVGDGVSQPQFGHHAVDGGVRQVEGEAEAAKPGEQAIEPPPVGQWCTQVEVDEGGTEQGPRWSVRDFAATTAGRDGRNRR